MGSTLRTPSFKIPSMQSCCWTSNYTVVIIAPFLSFFEPDRPSRDTASISASFNTCAIFSFVHEKYLLFLCMQRKSRNIFHVPKTQLLKFLRAWFGRIIIFASRLPWRYTGLGFDPMILNLSLEPASKTTATPSLEYLRRKSLISLSSDLRTQLYGETKFGIMKRQNLSNEAQLFV
jgi:hypothetical protein